MEDSFRTDIKERLSAIGITSFRSLFIGNKVIWVILALLAGISLIAVFSSSSMVIYKGGGNHSGGVFLKQLILLLVGMCITIVVSQYVYRMKPGLLRKHAFFWYVVSVILLLLTFTSAFSEEINGANRWINIFGFSIQPSEFAKLALVVYIARIFSENQDDVSDPKKVLYKVLASTAIVAGIVLISNFSTAMFIMLIMFFMLYLGGLPWKQFAAILGIGCGFALIMGFIILKEPQLFPRGETWQKRVVSFAPMLAPHASGYDASRDFAPIDNHQVTQAKIAIANGGLLGKGPGNSEQRYRLSQAYCDFIYAIIIEETGWIGAIFVIALYIWFMLQSLRLVRSFKHLFDTLVVLGLSFVLTTQAFLHMAVVVNLLPATGQTLPVISSGGSSLFITCIEFGIILGMSHYANNKNDSEGAEKQERSSKNIKTIENESVN
ncbi:MAG: cell division protein FtsW [Bacteroidales bacterium]|nr:cell division protein FtsW [Bacteroidales bacterium]